ncbi:hypothetical protein MKY95_19055 [Paenibacillus sp. FSL P4-0176]|uniref:hypothetical protein n=1 Tax=Paenibacillus sp. FSL P4-0176 TaxID=2921631 RepID=UPI0030CCDFBF
MVTKETKIFYEKVKKLFESERIYNGIETSEGELVRAGEENPERFQIFHDQFSNFVYLFTQDTITEYTITHLTDVEALRFKALHLDVDKFKCLVPFPNQDKTPHVI